MHEDIQVDPRAEPHICDGDVGPSLHQTPAAAPVCEWTNYFKARRSGRMDEFFVRGCDASHTDIAAGNGLWPSCGKPIKFKEN